MPRRTGRPGPPDPHDRAWADYTESFRREVLPSLLQSAYMVSVAGGVDPDHIDLRAATELGLMLLLDKPLMIVVPRGFTVPDALRRAATVVIDDVDMGDPRTQERIVEAVRQLKESGR